MHPKNILKKVIITSLFLLSLSSCTKKDAPQLGIDGQVYISSCYNLVAISLIHALYTVFSPLLADFPTACPYPVQTRH